MFIKKSELKKQNERLEQRVNELEEEIGLFGFMVKNRPKFEKEEKIGNLKIMDIYYIPIYHQFFYSDYYISYKCYDFSSNSIVLIKEEEMIKIKKRTAKPSKSSNSET